MKALPDRVIDALRLDVAFALRALRRTPGFSAAIVATLALGIGANAAMFSLADRLFLRSPAGVADPSSLRRLYVRSNWSVGSVWEIRSEMGYRAFVALDSSLAPRARLAAYTKPDTMTLVERDGSVTEVRGSFATADYFSVLGVRPALGRFYSVDEDVMGAGAPVAVISYGMWQSRFAGDRAVLGRTVDVARQRYTIVGVAAKDFTGADLNANDVWLPLATYAAWPIGGKPWFHSWRSGNFLRVLGRVTPGTTDSWLQTVTTTTFRRAELAGVTRGPDTSATVLPGPLLESLGPSINPAPEVAIAKRLTGVTLIVLLIACANVANLLLARAIGRRREIAVRLALGISRRRLVAHLLTESVILSAAAGIAAIVAAAWAGNTLRATMMPETHWAERLFDLRVALFAGTAALLTGIAAGLAPAIQASRPDLTTALKTGTRNSDARGSRLRRSLIVAQVALAVVLLHGAGLFVRSLSSVHQIDLGFDAERLVFATVKFANPEAHFIDPHRVHAPELSAGLAEASARLSSGPNVESTAIATAAPMRGYSMIAVYLPGGVQPPRLNDLDPVLITVSPSYFATTGVRLVRGRLFTDADRAGGPVIVVDEITARTYWPNEDAIGKCIILPRPTDPCYRVIGITKDSHLDSVIEQPAVAIFMPLWEAPGSLQYAAYLIVRAAPGEMSRVIDATRRELRRIFPRAEPPLVMATTRLLEPQLRPWRLGAVLFSAFGGLALVVAAIGVYSVIAYSVSQRAHEMSVRVALGAEAARLVRLIIAQSVRVIVVGVALGVAIALALGRLIASMLYDTSTHDPVVIAGVSVLLLVVAVLAGAVPAWRAGRADPVTALRAE
jgi:predicted permease